MKKTLIALPWVCLVLLASGSAIARERPNVLFILVDDLGWSDVGYNEQAAEQVMAQLQPMDSKARLCPQGQRSPAERCIPVHPSPILTTRRTTP